MYIRVRALPNSKKESIAKDGENRFIVCVKEPAEGNRANRRIIELVALELGMPAKVVRMIAGATSNTKLFSINSPQDEN